MVRSERPTESNYFNMKIQMSQVFSLLLTLTNQKKPGKFSDFFSGNEKLKEHLDVPADLRLIEA